MDLLDSSQQEDDPVDLLNSSQQDDSPVDLLDSSQQEDSTLEAVPEEPEIAPHELFFSCAICLEEHSIWTATSPGCAATACAGTPREKLCWAPSGALPCLAAVCMSK